MAHHFHSKDTSWNKVAPWYNKLTRGGEGHYYHEHIIIPNVLRLLSLRASDEISQNSNLLDLGCGNGVLAKHLPKEVKYTGTDLAVGLIKSAQREDKNYSHKYIIGDITSPLNLTEKFSHATIILALQNVNDPKAVFENASSSLMENGKLVIVINHPAFRIPRQSSWGIDAERKIQYRRVDKYMSPMNIPIRMNPSDPQSEETVSYHYPLSDYSKMLKNSGFTIDLIEEWTSDKESVGRAGKMENRSRNEIPLFMAILARKI